MHLFLNLLSLFNTIRSDCQANVAVIPPAAPEVCLVEPCCNNEVLCKLNVGFFLTESVIDIETDIDTISVFTPTVILDTTVDTVVFTTVSGVETITITEYITSITSISTSAFDSTIVFTETFSTVVTSYVPLNIFKISERRDSCCTSNSIVITFIKPLPKPIQEDGYLILSPKENLGLNIPHVFATTFNRFACIEQQIINDNFQVLYKIPLRDIESLIITITDLGIANVGAFKRCDEGLEVFLESDIFTNGPYTGFVPYFSERLRTPASYKLPSNLQIRLCALHKELRDCAIINRVSKVDINRMAVAAFINEVRWLFNCNRPCVKREICERVECDKVVECENLIFEYSVFVSACIKAIVYCEEKPDCKCSFVPQCAVENRWAAVQNNICAYASGCDLVNVQVCTDIAVLFSEICPCPPMNLKPCVDDKDICLLPFKEESSECDLSLSSEDEIMIKERAARRKKAAVKVKSETSVSTYGWYAAGGVVAVSVAVVVYVFVL